MHKIWLIIKREYLTKVRKKTFILSTVLFPVLYLALIIGSGYLAAKAGKKLKIALVDGTGLFTEERISVENKKDSSNIFVITKMDPTLLKQNLGESGFDGFVFLPDTLNWEKGPAKLELQTVKTTGIENTINVQKKLNNIWTSIKNEKLGIDEGKRKILQENTLAVNAVNIKDTRADAGIASGIGFVAAFLIYIILLLYGSQVMMGVMEEKTNRIAEVIVSSVKPFQLMLGKIIGIGLVAFTQILLWIVFVFIIYNVSSFAGNNAMNGVVGNIQKVFAATNLPLTLILFVFYLMGGFFFYSSLFAAMGSAVNEDMREAQSLSFPLMMPIIFSMILIGPILKDPTDPLAFWGSVIPFSSPIIMMVRVPFGVPTTVPWWQLGLSMAMLIAGFIFTTWFAGKIYRTGILMYGKKPSWKEMLRWAFRKN